MSRSKRSLVPSPLGIGKRLAAVGKLFAQKPRTFPSAVRTKAEQVGVAHDLLAKRPRPIGDDRRHDRRS